MCENCFQELIYKFPAHKDFEAFKNVIQLKCTERKLNILDKHKTDYLSAFDSNLYYQCRTCKEVWILNIPDNAWRGFFLPGNKALEYKRKLNKIDKKRSFGCLLILALILIILFYNLIFD